MRLLLDTHVALWWAYDQAEIVADARALMHRPDVQLYVSAASLWEVAIKASAGKLPQATESFPDDLHQAGVAILPVSGPHAWSIQRVAMPHNDPFDRLILAQVRLERLSLVTRDRALRSLQRDSIPA